MKQCEWITREPVYIKRIGNFAIDPSEFENEHGAFLCNRESPCHYVADPGHKFCPRHEMESALGEASTAPSACTGCIVPRPTAEADDALGVPREWREKHNDGGAA